MCRSNTSCIRSRAVQRRDASTWTVGLYLTCKFATFNDLSDDLVDLCCHPVESSAAAHWSESLEPAALLK